MPCNDALDIGQADADAFKFVSAMHPLKYSKEFARILHVKADAVIADEQDNLIRRLAGAANFYLGGIARAGVFDGVGKEVDKHLFQQEWIALNLRQWSPFPDDVAAGGFRFQALNGLFHH